MQVNSIQNYHPVRCAGTSNKINFNGEWQRASEYKYVDMPSDQVKMVYVPDEGETPFMIAEAWRQKTGLLPIDWVKENNPYNQSDKPVKYEIAGSPYMPIDVLKASVGMKNAWETDRSVRMKKLIEMAKLSAQINNYKAVDTYEKSMAEIMRQESSAKEMSALAMQMDNYSEKFGTNTKYRIMYGA